MEVRIQSIHFDASERLEAFVLKKVERLARHNNSINDVDVTLSISRPESIMNKEATIKVSGPSYRLTAYKTADSFEEALDVCLNAIDHQLDKKKENN